MGGLATQNSLSEASQMQHNEDCRSWCTITKRLPMYVEEAKTALFESGRGNTAPSRIGRMMKIQKLKKDLSISNF